ncbi:hypothetical protein ACI09F_000131 [Cronobacter turicensis]
MSTISNATRYWVGVDVYGTACHREQENGKWVKYEDYEELENELLALRKEREKAEPVQVPDLHKVIYHFRDLNEGFPVERFKADYVIAWMLANYPPAPIVPDDSLPFDSQIAEYEQMMEAEQTQADTTAQQFESLAGKAVVPEGWKLVPAQPTQAMCDAVLGRACFTFNGDGAKRIYEAMLSVAPEPCK